MNITYIANTTALGGAEYYLIQLLKGLNGCRCKVFMPASPVVEEFSTRAGSIPVELLTTDGYSLNPQRLLEAKRFYSRLDSDILHFNLANPCASTVDIIAAKLTGKSKIVLTTHLPTVASSTRERLSSRAAIRCADRVITVCSTARKHLLDMGALPSKVVSIYNGVSDWDTPAVRVEGIRHELGVDGSRICLGTVARLEEQKGLGYLLEAFALVVREYPSLVLCILGEGSRRYELEQIASGLNIQDSVRFLGWRDDYRDYIKAFDLFILPSLFESFPFSVVEAMFAGKPVIATDVGGVGEAVLDNVTGLLVKPGDSIGLSKAITELVKSPQTREAYGKRARLEACSKFGIETMISNTMAVYRELVPDGSGKSR